jgi:predicted Zn-ribbon and HTH transcriptional regulator
MFMAFNKNPFAMTFTGFNTNKRILFQNSMAITKNFYPDEIQLMRFILYRKKINMNTLILICGNVRTGKSYDAMILAQNYARITGKPFKVEESLSFDLMPFLKWSKYSKEGFYILDEVGNTLNAQDWYLIQSKIMRNFIFAQGFRKNILALILPSAMSLNKTIRFMMNYVIETVNQGYAKWYKIYMKHSIGKAHMIPMGGIRFPIESLSKETIQAYELMKKDWNDKELKEDIDYMDGLKETKYWTLPKKDLDNAVKFKLISDEKYVDDLTSKHYKKEDAQIMLELAKRYQKRGFPHTCYSCGKEWTSQAEHPAQCPKCFSRSWDSLKF